MNLSDGCRCFIAVVRLYTYCTLLELAYYIWLYDTYMYIPGIFYHIKPIIDGETRFYYMKPIFDSETRQLFMRDLEYETPDITREDVINCASHGAGIHCWWTRTYIPGIPPLCVCVCVFVSTYFYSRLAGHIFSWGRDGKN